MEKFRIAQYGFIQMVALSYGILGSGVVAKAGKTMLDHGMSVSATGTAITFFHDYGIFLSLIIVGWAVFCAFHSTIFSRINMTEGMIVTSGLLLAGLFFIIGTIMILSAFIAVFAPFNSV